MEPRGPQGRMVQSTRHATLERRRTTTTRWTSPTWTSKGPSTWPTPATWRNTLAGLPIPRASKEPPTWPTSKSHQAPQVGTRTATELTWRTPAATTRKVRAGEARAAGHHRAARKQDQPPDGKARHPKGQAPQPQGAETTRCRDPTKGRSNVQPAASQGTTSERTPATRI